MQASTLRTSVAIRQDKFRQLSHLCILLGALNETCKSQQNARYSSGDINGDCSLTKPQIFLNKLAQICDTQKGPSTMTALVCLQGSKGPEYLFCSNSRKESELERTKEFLFGILEFVLWRILEYNSGRVVFYLKSLINQAKCCLTDCMERGENEDSETFHQLSLLLEKASFPYDMTSDDARSKTLSSCETLLKEILKARRSPFATVLGIQARDEDVERSYSWSELRHYLGRLYSYRQAADIISAAPGLWPDLFKDFSVRYIPSAPQVRLPIPPPLSLEQAVSVAFPSRDLSEFDADISALKVHGLENHLSEQIRSRDKKTLVHGETQLNYLIQHEKTRSAEFWSSSAFIATSKPPCRLCHFYFNSTDNNFQVSPPHMNLYPKWRLPDLNEDQGQEAIEYHDSLTGEIIEELQDDIERILAEKSPIWKRNDSRTDSYAGSSAWYQGKNTGSTGTRTHDTTSKMMDPSDGVGSGRYSLSSSPSTPGSWNSVSGSDINGVCHGLDSHQNGR